jgi:hypothetical protein
MHALCVCVCARARLCVWVRVCVIVYLFRVCVILYLPGLAITSDNLRTCAHTTHVMCMNAFTCTTMHACTRTHT